jgi:hypothetical protein
MITCYGSFLGAEKAAVEVLQPAGTLLKKA